MVKHLCLCLQDSVSCTKIFQMTQTNICDHPDIRLCHRCQTVHLSKIGNSHFQYRDFVFCANLKNSERKSDLIVKVSLCLKHFIPLFQNGSYHFLGACFSDTSRNSNHFTG